MSALSCIVANPLNPLSVADRRQIAALLARLRLSRSSHARSCRFLTASAAQISRPGAGVAAEVVVAWTNC